MGGTCVYYQYEYQCLCAKGFVQSIDYESGVIINELTIPSPDTLHKCADIDECRYGLSVLDVDISRLCALRVRVFRLTWLFFQTIRKPQNFRPCDNGVVPQICSLHQC